MMPHSQPAVADEPRFEIRFNSQKSKVSLTDQVCRFDLPVPLLAGKGIETLRFPQGKIAQEDPLLLIEEGDMIFGATVAKAPDRLEEPVREAYSHILKACTERGMHLHRVWNYVPDINAQNQGLERYRQFNIGRWLAFEKHFGRDLRAFMPAASAVGMPGKCASFFFIAGKTEPIYLENPSQVPAYHYPSDYGPKPPSFARAVLVKGPEDITGYLSGTASIEGHRSIGEDDWHLQFRTTMHNIQIMLERMGMTELLKGRAAAEQAGINVHDFRCYLRHVEMLPLIRDWLHEELALDESCVSFQQADICRAELDLEIEAVLTKRI
jgi:chorismate lyase / 3-hydroxybenzoate synthase